jgi:hypothetical protein
VAHPFSTSIRSPTIPGTPARIIPLHRSSDSCPSLCGCPILRRFCEGWVFLVLVLVSVSVSLLLPRFPSNPSTHPACTNSFPHTDRTGNYSTPIVSHPSPALASPGSYGGWPTFSQLPFVVPTIPGTAARMIPLDHSSESCPSLCGCPILRRFCEGWVFSVLVLVLMLVSVSLLLPRFPSNPSTHPVCTNPLPHTDKTGNYSTPTA